MKIKRKFVQSFGFQFLNGCFETKFFRPIDWILNLIPLRPSFGITSTDHWSWLRIDLDFIDLFFSFEVFGFGIIVDIFKHFRSSRITFIDERKSWEKDGVFNGKEFVFDYKMPLFGGIRGLLIRFDLAEGWDVFLFDFDFAEWFGGLNVLFLCYTWSIKEK